MFFVENVTRLSKEFIRPGKQKPMLSRKRNSFDKLFMFFMGSMRNSAKNLGGKLHYEAQEHRP